MVKEINGNIVMLCTIIRLLPKQWTQVLERQGFIIHHPDIKIFYKTRERIRDLMTHLLHFPPRVWRGKIKFLDLREIRVGEKILGEKNEQPKKSKDKVKSLTEAGRHTKGRERGEGDNCLIDMSSPKLKKS